MYEQHEPNDKTEKLQWTWNENSATVYTAFMHTSSALKPYQTSLEKYFHNFRRIEIWLFDNAYVHLITSHIID